MPAWANVLWEARNLKSCSCLLSECSFFFLEMFDHGSWNCDNALQQGMGMTLLMGKSDLWSLPTCQGYQGCISVSTRFSPHSCIRFKHHKHSQVVPFLTEPVNRKAEAFGKKEVSVRDVCPFGLILPVAPKNF